MKIKAATILTFHESDQELSQESKRIAISFH